MCEHLEIVPPLRCDACNAAGLAPDLCDAADEFLDEALTILKPGGIIHYYDIREEDDLFDGAEATIKDAASARGMTVRVLDRRIVRSYSPHQYNVVLDVEVCGG